MNLSTILEIVGTIFGLAYVILAAQKNIWCWLMGIISSIVGIVVFVFFAKLYAEAFLSFFYVVTGVIGWVQWNKPKTESRVIKVELKSHFLLILLASIGSVGFFALVTTFFKDAARPLLDSFTTVFSFFATWITIKKWLSSWIYWIVIDAVSVYLYWSRGLEIYAGLMFVYTILAVYGFVEWKRNGAEYADSGIKKSDVLDA